ncbi:5-bromo-4-chloroindolyl phosphate hydrolysis family protein [Falsibacillus pallidus]|uniref:5-bromo-4-chloroindolyl phosphate hydrolysis family protein n=1 Tax=Falsibacillus pallidus TaxID=493781 RepID=UPI003D957ED9
MMSIIRFAVRSLLGACSGFIVWLITYFNMDFTFLFSSLTALGASIFIYFIVKWIQLARIYRKYGLTRKEYQFILKNLKQASGKLRRLQRSIINLRSISAFRQFYETQKLSRKIVKTVKIQPQLFFTNEEFFYKHLDSAVEIAEKYSLLSSQAPVNPDVRHTLQEAKKSISIVNSKLEADLMKLMSHEIQKLNVEIDYIKLHNQWDQDKNGIKK